MIGLRGLLGKQATLAIRRRFAVITRFSKEHEWVSFDETTKIGTVGITDHAQSELGDIVYVKLPELNAACKQNDGIGEIESVKTVANLYTPISGTVVELNAGLEDDYSVLNKVRSGDAGAAGELDLQDQGFEPRGSGRTVDPRAVRRVPQNPQPLSLSK